MENQDVPTYLFLVKQDKEMPDCLKLVSQVFCNLQLKSPYTNH